MVDELDFVEAQRRALIQAREVRIRAELLLKEAAELERMLLAEFEKESDGPG